jgi:hypothetical protein
MQPFLPLSKFLTNCAIKKFKALMDMWHSSEIFAFVNEPDLP